MKRVVFDCNIFLQALARPQSPAGICFQLAEQGIIHIYISDEIMTEIGDVLRRPVIQTRFPQLTETVIGAFLEHIRRIGLYYSAILITFRICEMLMMNHTSTLQLVLMQIFL